MCTSRYFRVVEAVNDTAVVGEDVDGRRHRLSLIAYDGPPIQPGGYVVAHAGYALAPVVSEEATRTFDELRGFDGAAPKGTRKAHSTSKEGT
ncbi:MAG: HypC/HybG/HupF family hydrogenase formation chaperone [Acidimicrobiales bacterium]